MQEVETIIRLNNVRLSFPSLTEHEKYEGQDTGKYGCTLLMPHATQGVMQVEKGISDAIKLKWGKKPPPANKLKTSFRNGDDEKYDGYAGMMALKATNKNRLHLILRDRSPIEPDEVDQILYPGCYVNATISFNAGKDSYNNNRVWCNLRALQFYKRGEKFGGGVPVDIDAEFESFSDEEEIPADMGV